jgi:hypothetical protein
MSNPHESEDFTEGVAPIIAPAPVPSRPFVPAPWHRPRKQYIRSHQWNHEVVELIIKQRPAAADSVIRVLGLPSSEYLDLLSMREVCESHGQTIQYLGFNVGFRSMVVGPGELPSGPVDLQRELQSLRVFGASSFVHNSSRIIPDLFEQIRLDDSMAKHALGSFSDFDVLNLDLCGCIVDKTPERAEDLLHAVASFLRWQCVRRLRPWLFFLTTFASATEINRQACMTMVAAVRENSDTSEEFRNELQSRMGIDSAAIERMFADQDAAVPSQREFLEIFALAVGKWLSARLQLPSPKSLVSMLPSFYFRHEGFDEPHILSLAYLIEPSPVAGAAGIETQPAPLAVDAGRASYVQRAKKIIGKCRTIRDLDEMMDANHTLRGRMTDQTEELLTGCGFDPAAVAQFLAPYRVVPASS